MDIPDIEAIFDFFKLVFDCIQSGGYFEAYYDKLRYLVTECIH